MPGCLLLRESVAFGELLSRNRPVWWWGVVSIWHPACHRTHSSRSWWYTLGMSTDPSAVPGVGPQGPEPIETEVCGLLVRYAPDVLFHFAGGRLDWVSAGVEDLVGSSPEVLTRLDVAALVHPDEAGLLAELGARLVRDGAASGMMRVRSASGEFVWIEVSLRHAPTEDGGFGFVGSARSAAEVARLRDELAESQERFRLAMHHAPIGMCLVAPEGGFITVNDALCTAFARDAASLITATWQELTHPDDLEVDLQFAQQVLDGTRESYRLRKRFLRPDGSLVWGDLSVGCVRNVDRTVRYFVSQVLDVTDLVTAEQALVESETRYRLLAENASDVVIHVVDGWLVWISPSISSVLGGLPGDWLGQPVDALVHPDDLVTYLDGLDAITAEPAVVRRLRARAIDGTYHWVEANARSYRNEAGGIDGFIASLRLVDALVASEAELDHQARFDSLTGLMNRKEILQRISKVTTRGRRTGEETAVLFCDIDNFKDINDTYGHAAGDEVLRTISERVTATIREDDVAARIGGDEFLVLLTGVHDLPETTAIAEKIRTAVAASIGLDHARVTPTLSIGATLARIDESTDHLIARADRAMYEAKNAGRDRVVSLPA